MDSKLVIPVFAVLGALVVLRVVLLALHSIYAKFLRPGKNLKKFGDWAVVTGATDGIGKAFAQTLARRGMNVFIISRTKSKLEETAVEIKAMYPNVEVKLLDVDYSAFDEAQQHRVGEALARLSVGVLVNNVGVSYSFCKYFDELTDAEVKGLVELNVNSTVWMTRLVLPGMLERRKGAIVNISSTAGVVPSPLLAGYSAAKGYIEMFTKALAVEYRGTGVHFQVQVPIFVATKLAKIRKTSLFVPSPRAYAAAAVRCIGYETVCSPYWAHALQLWAIKSIPEFVRDRLLLSMHLGIRSKGMKKEADKQA